MEPNRTNYVKRKLEMTCVNLCKIQKVDTRIPLDASNPLSVRELKEIAVVTVKKKVQKVFLSIILLLLQSKRSKLLNNKTRSVVCSTAETRNSYRQMDCFLLFSNFPNSIPSNSIAPKISSLASHSCQNKSNKMSRKLLRQAGRVTFKELSKSQGTSSVVVFWDFLLKPGPHVTKYNCFSKFTMIIMATDYDFTPK